VAFDGNYYWVPEKIQGKLTVIEYERHIDIYHSHTKLITYPLAPWNVKNQQIIPEGAAAPSQVPRSRKVGFKEEEKRLRELGPVCTAYLDYVRSKECKINQKPKFIRQLYRLHKQMGRSLLLNTLQRALDYRVASIASIERIAEQLIKQQMPQLPDLPPANHYEHRKTFQEGRFSTEADLGRYRKLLEEQEDG
jgi:hypothetical protein